MEGFVATRFFWLGGRAEWVFAAVADVQLTGGIRKHHEAIVWILRCRQIGIKNTVVVPEVLPLVFDFTKGIIFSHRIEQHSFCNFG